MEHIVRFNRGYDCIKFECAHGSEACKPGSGGSHGRHGLEILFVSKGDAGAVQFQLFTDWFPQHVAPSSIGVHECQWGDSVMPAYLGYHSKTPHYDGRDAVSRCCEFCDGKQCYYDGSGLNANDAMYALVNGGDAALWAFLDAYYDHVFHGAAYPAPAEYAAKLRAAAAG